MKRQGPFEIIEVLGPLTYKLKLPNQWRIHPVFHASLLTPYRENSTHGPNFTLPPPDLIDGEEEFEVEKVLDSRIARGLLQYLVKWKGFPGEDSWEPHFNVTHASEAVEKFHAEHPGAPRVIKASLFASLLPSLRPPENYTDISDSDYPHADLSWEHGKYSVDSASRGRSVLGGG